MNENTLNVLPILYSFRRCPYAMRARLALAVSGQTYELREVLLREKPPELITASAKASVPVLVLACGEVLQESLDIMHWTLRQHDPQHWLEPELGDMSSMLALIDHNDGRFKRQLDRYKYPHRFRLEAGENLQQFARSNRDSAALWLLSLNAQLAKHQGWLLGAAPSLADMATLPFIRQFAHTDAAWFAQQPWTELIDWLALWERSDLLASVMEKYPRWQSGQNRTVLSTKSAV
jgi:glutathione S-transferase